MLFKFLPNCVVYIKTFNQLLGRNFVIYPNVHRPYTKIRRI